MVVHPAHGHHGDTLADWVAPWVTPEPASERPGIVHRLDRDTTGLLVVARTPRARQALAEAIAARTVRREYVALARGHLAPERGVIDAPIGRDPTNRQRMAVVWGGRDARTDYRTLATFRQASLLHCRLQTGRTHQIRVHLASSGHPVLGDEVYGGHWPAASHGQLLHAIRLAFRHPVTGHMLDFVQWPPPDWREAARWLGPATITADTVFSDRSESTRQLLAELGWVGSPADPPGSG
jgi:23S rRNA pseudouridine1911/1915/1917 synthase